MPPLDFQSDVVEHSYTIPVLVDFWAPWCGPCRVLGPVLDELAQEYSGRFELVKLDTDEQPDVAQAYGIRGIPAVKLFHRGSVIAEFVGALGRQEVRRWLDAHLPNKDVERLERLMASWPERGAQLTADLERFVAEHPDVAQGPLRLAQTLVARDPRRALELIGAADLDVDLAELADDLKNLAELVEAGELSRATERGASHLAEAGEAFASHDLDRALARLVDAAMADKHYANDLARRAAVALFHLLGQDHDLTQKHQRRLAMAIHS
jgi:putative thioredoxin